MKKFALVVIALASFGVVVPTIASAETVVIKHGHPHHWDRGLHRGWDHSHHKTIIVKKHY